MTREAWLWLLLLAAIPVLVVAYTTGSRWLALGTIALGVACLALDTRTRR